MRNGLRSALDVRYSPCSNSGRIAAGFGSFGSSVSVSFRKSTERGGKFCGIYRLFVLIY